MEIEWVSIALGDVVWISAAFVMGFLVKLIGLPPLVGFLVTGFILNYFNITSGEVLEKLADLGITLLLFTVGLKLKLNVLIKPQVWAVTMLHTSIIISLFGSVIFGLALLEFPLFEGLDYKLSLMIAFALSFSSTIFVVKSLEEQGKMNSLHGRIAIGVLVMQDLVAVIFLAASTGKIPSVWAFLLFLLIPLRPFIHYIMARTGHGELMILFGLVLALGGAQLFELGGVKGDLGALIMGVLVSTHSKANELSKSMLGFKDLFLVGFFLSVGMTGKLSLDALVVGIILVPFILVKSAFFFALMTRFKLRARTSLLATLSLTNYSEFGLIIAAIAVDNAWIASQWLVVMALALSFSFVVAVPMNSRNDKIYNKYRNFWQKLQSKERLPDDSLLDTGTATIAIFGMGRVGSGAYDRMCELYGETIVGVDVDIDRVKKHKKTGRNVLHGNPSDADFWEIINQDHHIEMVMLALPNLEANLHAL
ncbi:MAG: cation:proton antiporter, partial [Thiohalomonadales bacterium]